MASKTFPLVQGKNLLRQEFAVPRDLSAAVSAVLVGFQRPHQAVFDQWVPLLTELEKSYGSSQFKYYELPSTLHGCCEDCTSNWWQACGKRRRCVGG